MVSSGVLIILYNRQSSVKILSGESIGYNVIYVQQEQVLSPEEHQMIPIRFNTIKEHLLCSVSKPCLGPVISINYFEFHNCGA